GWHMVLSETRQYGKRCYRAKEFHASLWLRLSGPAMLVYPKIATRSRWRFLGIFMVCCGCGTWSSHAGLSETRQHGKLCYRAEGVHASLWLRLPGPAMLVYPKLVSTESSVTAPRGFMLRCG
ncbi:MAG: hypothetical protein ACK5PS_05490, partial [Desulfopila sp.]